MKRTSFLRIQVNVEYSLTICLVIAIFTCFLIFYVNSAFMIDREMQHISQVYYLMVNNRICTRYPGHVETIVSPIMFSIINKVIGTIPDENNVTLVFTILSFNNVFIAQLYYFVTMLTSYIIVKRITHNKNYALISSLINVGFLYRLPLYGRAIYAQILYLMLLLGFVLDDVNYQKLFNTKTFIIYLLFFFPIVASDPAHTYVLILSLLLWIIILYIFGYIINTMKVINNVTKKYILLYLTFIIIFFSYYMNRALSQGIINIFKFMLERLEKSLKSEPSNQFITGFTHTNLYLLAYYKRLIDYFMLFLIIITNTLLLFVFYIKTLKTQKPRNRSYYFTNYCYIITNMFYSLLFVNSIILIFRGYRLTLIPIVAIIIPLTYWLLEKSKSTKYSAKTTSSTTLLGTFIKLSKTIMIIYIGITLVTSPILTMVLYPKYEISTTEIYTIKFIKEHNIEYTSPGVLLSCWTFPTLYEILLKTPLYSVMYCTMNKSYILNFLLVSKYTHLIVTDQILSCCNKYTSVEHYTTTIIYRSLLNENSLIYSSSVYNIIIYKHKIYA